MNPAINAARGVALVALLAGAVVIACGTNAPSSIVSFDAAPEGAVPDLCKGQDAGAVPQDGGGYCCPVLIIATHWCSGNFPLGGWSADQSGCCKRGAPTDTAYVATVDSHGCGLLVVDPDEHHCCNCPCTFQPSTCSDYDAAAALDASQDAPDAE